MTRQTHHGRIRAPWQVQMGRGGGWHNLPPIIDAPDMHAEEFYPLHDLSPRTPLGNVSIAMLCITTAIAAAAVGWFLAMLHYT